MIKWKKTKKLMLKRRIWITVMRRKTILVERKGKGRNQLVVRRNLLPCLRKGGKEWSWGKVQRRERKGLKRSRLTLKMISRKEEEGGEVGRDEKD